jgi:hypothetical protein
MYLLPTLAWCQIFPTSYTPWHQLINLTLSLILENVYMLIWFCSEIHIWIFNIHIVWLICTFLDSWQYFFNSSPVRELITLFILVPDMFHAINLPRRKLLCWVTNIYSYAKAKLTTEVNLLITVEGGTTRCTTALVYYCIHSSLYTRTVQGC